MRTALFRFALALGSALGSVAPVAAQAPANDEPAGALPIVAGYNGMFSNVGATDTPGYWAVCSGGGHANVFFVFVPAVSGLHTFSTCRPLDGANGTVGHVLSVFDASAPPPVNAFECDDDSCVGLGGVVSTFLTAGAACLVMVGTYSAASTGTFHLTVVPPPSAPASDTCANAPAVGEGYTQVSLVGATPSNPNPPCTLFGASNPDVWLAYTPAESGTVVVHREHEGITRLTVYEGGCGAPVNPAGSNVCGPVNVPPNLNLVTKWAAVAGQTYLLRIGDFNASTAVGYVYIARELSLSFDRTPTAPGYSAPTIADRFGRPNEVCLNVLTLSEGAFPAGWFFGVDIPFAELFALPTLGAPFVTTLDAAGASAFALPALPDPLGITVYTVALTFDASGFKTGQSLPTAFSL